MSIHDRNAYNDKKKSKDQIIFFYLIDYVDNHQSTDIVIRKIFVAKRSHAPRNDRFLFVEQSVYKSIPFIKCIRIRYLTFGQV